ncbi:MAG: acyl-CoA dehydratase activase [Clostridia bacterium]|nr:acyl-CoA dehydratase activase [Clostridia bacterium]
MTTIGLDIGSTSTKYVAMEDGALLYQNRRPTGWSSAEVAAGVREDLAAHGFDAARLPCVSTGYGRVNVPYADKVVTEITCHAKGASFLFGTHPATVLDIGGQDTKVIVMADGAVKDFVMNDKCSAGTGRFLEVMANALGLDPATLCELARYGSGVTISSMCTVFAESEVIGLIGAGVSRENIACGIVDSIVGKVASQCSQLATNGLYYLTGGLCACPYIVESLSKKLRAPVETRENAMYAGAVGAAIIGAAL